MKNFDNVNSGSRYLNEKMKIDLENQNNKS